MAAFEMRQKQEEGEELEPGKGAQRKVAAAEKIYKKAFRRANLRWHPDKFTAKYGKYLDDKRSSRHLSESGRNFHDC